MEIETKCEVSERFVPDNATAAYNGVPEQQHKCGECDRIASHSVTDAVEAAPGEWRESEPRFGCARHPVKSLVKFVTGKIVTWEAFIHDAT